MVHALKKLQLIQREKTQFYDTPKQCDTCSNRNAAEDCRNTKQCLDRKENVNAVRESSFPGFKNEHKNECLESEPKKVVERQENKKHFIYSVSKQTDQTRVRWGSGNLLQRSSAVILPQWPEAKMNGKDPQNITTHMLF